jgi:POT family proton-dependent oligopeptide transporter
MKAYAWLFVLAAAFWLLYDQGESVLADFAEERTNRSILGWSFPGSWFQAVNPIYIILLAPLAAWFWPRRGRAITTPMKFTVGLLLSGLSFVLMSAAASKAIDGELVSLWWLVGVYGIQTLGELALSPVGLSVTTRLAPTLYPNQMMGIWFLSVACGDAIGTQVARLTDEMNLPHYFLAVGRRGGVLALNIEPNGGCALGRKDDSIRARCVLIGERATVAP